MSTFCGKLQEIPEISIDRFDGENLNSEVFFLSHCHADHMRGLNHYFFDNLISTNKHLYASEISCKILEKKYLATNLKPLSPYLPTDVCLNNKTISVTSIPAGHCPGSLMFLIESKERVLYTGDYRIHKHDIKKLKAFYNSFDEIKSVEKIYLDTTFFSKSYPQFPTREQSLQEFCRIIRNILETGDKALIHIKTGAYYGYEWCFKEIYEKFNMPVHVNHNSYECYRFIPDMDKCVTLDSSLTQIHSCCGGYKKICNSYSEVHDISLTAFRWTEENLDSGISEYKQGCHFICYSTHASYEEGVALLTFLKPKEIEMCVLDEKDDDVNQVLIKLVSETLNDIKKENVPKVKPKFFKETSFERKSKTERNKWHNDVEILKSPTRVRKKFRWTRSEEVESDITNRLLLQTDSECVENEDVNQHIVVSEKEEIDVNILDILDLNSPKKNESHSSDRKTVNKLFCFDGTKSEKQKQADCENEIEQDINLVDTVDEFLRLATPEKTVTSDKEKESVIGVADEFFCFSTPEKQKTVNEVEKNNQPSTSFTKVMLLDEIFGSVQADKEKLLRNELTDKNLPSTSSDFERKALSSTQNSDDGNIILSIIDSTVKKSLDFGTDAVEMFEDDSQNDILRDIMDSKTTR